MPKQAIAAPLLSTLVSGSYYDDSARPRLVVFYASKRRSKPQWLSVGRL